MSPLAGLHVLDLSRFLSGPFATQLLADYGADVISIESPRGRELAAKAARDSYFFLSAHRGKRSLALDLKQPAGRLVLARNAGQVERREAVEVVEIRSAHHDLDRRLEPGVGGFVPPDHARGHLLRPQ